MMKEDLKTLAIVTGQTVTPGMIEAATAAGLPEQALAELWPRRTLNKQAMKNIEAALAPVETAAPAETEDETESETTEQ
tara:strand:+ start:1145 stop:1381 length:237 start_codon:yes stop_codon:yes gene_type:complete